jgi:hypothetical protein
MKTTNSLNNQKLNVSLLHKISAQIIAGCLLLLLGGVISNYMSVDLQGVVLFISMPVFITGVMFENLIKQTAIKIGLTVIGLIGCGVGFQFVFQSFNMTLLSIVFTLIVYLLGAYVFQTKLVPKHLEKWSIGLFLIFFFISLQLYDREIFGLFRLVPVSLSLITLVPIWWSSVISLVTDDQSLENIVLPTKPLLFGFLLVANLLLLMSLILPA